MLLKPLSALQQYAVVTANYWAFTLTDGALRMLVVFHFHELGYSTLEIAFLFLFYEFFGIITNLYGGYLGARFGLRLTLWAGTLMQVGALLMLIPVADSWPKWWSVAYVMLAQAISGVAKDLNKMSAKSAIKTVVPETPNDQNQGEKQLFKWVAILTGSKNALKGVGFFLGGILLTTIGFNAAVAVMAAALFLAFLLTLVLPAEIGRMKQTPAFSSLFLNREASMCFPWLDFPIRCPRRVVCGCPAGVFAGSPRLAFLGSWRLYGPLGDRLWNYSSCCTKSAPSVGKRGAAGRCCSGILERLFNCNSSPDCNCFMAPSWQPRACGSGGFSCVWSGVCNEFIYS